MVKLDLITGFLGAGKTTLINKLLAEAYSGEKPVLIENEFGDVSIDDRLIADPNAQVRVLASGCVCCTLKSDFVSGMIEVVNRYSPARIIIEPSGLADPVDILAACSEVCASVSAQVNSFITIANAENLIALLTVGGELFHKQIANAKLLLLNRVHVINPNELSHVMSAVRELNPDCLVLPEGSDPLDGLSILTLAEEAAASSRIRHTSEKLCDCHGEHHHDAKSSFEDVGSLAFSPEKAFSNKDMEGLFALFAEGGAGRILRAKGFLKKDGGGYFQMQYVYGRGELLETKYAGPSKLVIIGSRLNEGMVSEFFAFQLAKMHS